MKVCSGASRREDVSFGVAETQLIEVSLSDGFIHLEFDIRSKSKHDLEMLLLPLPAAAAAAAAASDELIDREKTSKGGGGGGGGGRKKERTVVR